MSVTADVLSLSDDGRSRRSARRKRRFADNLTGYAFLIPGILCFALFSWYPAIKAIRLSFQHTNFVSKATWSGWSNYSTLVHDPQFWDAWRNTLQFTGAALLIGFAIPFLTALVMNELRHATTFLRLVVYLPVMIPPVVSALLWRWFYAPGTGLFDEALTAGHLPNSSWIYSPTTAIISLVLVSTWANMGGTVLVYLAALQNIPGELYEAAELDGAGLFQRIRHVTLPQTRFVLLMLMLLQVIATMQEFTEVFVMTSGGPQNSTVTVLYLIYKYAFVYFNYGAACALSVMLFIVLAAFSAVYLRLTRSHG